MGWYGTLAEFDITSGCIIDTFGFTQLRWFNTLHGFFQHGFNGCFQFVWQLGALGGKELDTVVSEAIVRRTDDNARIGVECAGQVGNGRGGHGAK